VNASRRDSQELLLGTSADIADVEDLEQIEPGSAYVEGISPIEEVLQTYKAQAHARLDALVQQLDDLRQRASNS